MKKVRVLRRERWRVLKRWDTHFVAENLPPRYGRRRCVFWYGMATDADQPKIKVGVRFVEQEYYEDTPGGRRTHCWRIRFPWGQGA